MRLTIVAAAAALLLISPAFARGAPAASSPTAATPMMGGMLIIHHKVANYAKWRAVYDADEPNRTAAGLTNCQVRKSLDNANDVVIACDMADVKSARKFGSSKTLMVIMKKAGVQGRPQLLYLAAAQ